MNPDKRFVYTRIQMHFDAASLLKVHQFFQYNPQGRSIDALCSSPGWSLTGDSQPWG